MVNIEKDFGKKIKGLLNEHVSKLDFLKRGFAVASEIPDDTLLFIGINPSFSKLPEPTSPAEEFYPLDQETKHPYFKKFHKISSHLNVPWSHWDLLMVRETKQNIVAGMAGTEEGYKFISANLALSKEVLEASRPRAIVVSNTFARNLFWGVNSPPYGSLKLGYDLEWNDEIGTYRITMPDSNLDGVHVFFSGMLSGQRALDLGSLQRLSWQIKMLGVKEGWITHPPKQQL